MDKNINQPDDEMLSAQQVISRLCKLQEEVFRKIGDSVLPADCFCGEGGFWKSGTFGGTYEEGYRNSGIALQFIEKTVREKLERPAEAPASSGHTMKWDTENESLQHARAEAKKWETKFNECFDLWVKSSNEIESLSKELQEARALLKESLMEIQTGYGLAGLTGPKADPKGLVKRITDNLKDR